MALAETEWGRVAWKLGAPAIAPPSTDEGWVEVVAVGEEGTEKPALGACGVTSGDLAGPGRCRQMGK